MNSSTDTPSWVVLFAFVITSFTGCSEYASPDARAMKDKLMTFDLEKSATDRNLVRFDVMETEVITKQQWVRFHDLHAQDVVVNWPDGHSTKGVDMHVEEAKVLLTFAPDAWVEAHPVKFGSGDWTCITGTIVGTFSKPMVLSDAKVIQPTGRRFRISVCTILRWKDGKIVEKSWYWDNQALRNQLGIREL